MSVAHDHLKRPTDEAAMARVLAAEREARAARGRLLIFVGLAEGIAIYGVIISILILERLA
jgi:V/A-type H+-transporting ATPase subunit K